MRHRFVSTASLVVMLAAVYFGSRQQSQVMAVNGMTDNHIEDGYIENNHIEDNPMGDIPMEKPRHGVQPALSAGVFGLPVQEGELPPPVSETGPGGEPGEQPQTSSEEQEDTDENEYANLAIADVTDYVNVRSLPGTDGEIVGKIYDGAVAQIIETAGEKKDWFHVTSGSVEGYIKAEYFIYGQAALEVMDDYVTRYVRVQADRLNVRKDADREAKRIGYLDQGEKALLLENCGEWMKVQYSHGEEGYVSSQYVMVQEEFTYARSMEEERQEKERLKALQERQSASEESAPESVANVTPPNTDYGSNAELREELIAYAMQFLGVQYVHGGSSLTEGTDCSGFTSLIYADFGYSIGRTPSSQLSSAGRGIDYSEIQKGDIICYGKNGKCTHVAIYIGDGQIIHEANARKGVVIYQADYDTILGVRNVID
ncbi:MAG: SH3 domain-containing protein [Roseburia sp.]|nr:SH3 domain-containing protein [Roseburia sp.]